MDAVYYMRAEDERGESLKRLSRAAALYTGLPLGDERLLVRRAGNGAPFFPLLRSIHCSVSHSGGIWLCALSRERIGADLQVREEAPVERIARRFFHPTEVKYLEREGFESFFALWCAKESYLKYTGEGLAGGPGLFSVIEDGRLAREINGVRLRVSEPFEGYWLGICGGEKHFKVEKLPAEENTKE